MALEDKTRPQDFNLDAELAEAVRAHCKEGKLPCAQAFTIAQKYATTPDIVGHTADVLGIHLSHCQLGLFGYPDHAKGWPEQGWDVSTELQAELTAAAVEGQLPCAAIWDIAARLHIPKMHVGYAVDQMKVRIIQCQLGAF